MTHAYTIEHTQDAPVCAACGEPVSYADEGGCVGTLPNAYHMRATCVLEAYRREAARVETLRESVEEAIQALEALPARTSAAQLFDVRVGLRAALNAQADHAWNLPVPKTLDLCMVPLEYLRAAPWAKRPHPPLVETIAKKFDLRLFGFLTVSKQSDTEFIVIDGMERWEALLRLGASGAPCFVLSGLTEKREAEIRMEMCRPAHAPSARRGT